MINKLILTLALLPSLAAAQEPDALEGLTVRSAEVSGIGRDQLSPGLRQAIDAIVDQPYSGGAIAALARRIEQEQPDYVAEARAVAQPPDGVRVIFLTARIGDTEDVDLNINARYTVESVELSGVPQSEVSQNLWDDMQALVGQMLDPERADELQERLETELGGYDVERRIERGSLPGQIRLILEVERIPWIPFAPSRAKGVYHSKQGFGLVADGVLAPGRHHRFRIGGVISNDDDLVERYTGYRIGYENRRAGTDRLGFSMEFSSFREVWRPATLLALQSFPAIPEPYRDRRTLDTAITFAISPWARVSVGASASELESLTRAPLSETANAAVASIAYGDLWEEESGAAHSLEAAYAIRAGTRTLDSDLVYTRHFGQARYTYETGRNTVLSTFSAGRVTGRAPLFERFTLGDSATLRGWNKYDIAPAGADNVVYHSLEYRYGSDDQWGAFIDTGSLWNSGLDPKVRVSTGLGYFWDADSCRTLQADDETCGSISIAFPVTSGGVKPMLMLRIEF